MPLSTGNGEIRSVTLGTVMLAGKVTWGSSGAVSSGPDAEQGFTVADTDTGRFTVTFSHKYRSFLAMSAITDSQGTVIGGTWEIHTPYDPSTGTLVLSHSIEEAEADPTSGNETYFAFWMKNTDVGPSST